MLQLYLPFSDKIKLFALIFAIEVLFALQILPDGVGFKLGAETEYTNLVLLIHYKNLVSTSLDFIIKDI